MPAIRPVRATTLTVRVADTATGNAGAVQARLIDKMPAALKEGLNIEWVSGNPGQMQVQLVSGSLDVAFSGAIGTVDLNARGADLVLFGPGTNFHIRWVVRGDSPYFTPRDLIGKRIATQAEGSEQYKLSRVIAARNGVDLKRDVEVIFGPATSNLALFERGDVEAVLVPEPTATRLVARGARQIAHLGELWQKENKSDIPTFLVGLAARRRWVEENRNAATQIARLFALANRSIHDRPALLSEHAADLGIPPGETDAIGLLPQRMAGTYTTTWNKSLFDLIECQTALAVESGVLRQAPEKSFLVASSIDGS
ncbi:ABC transporter substrate-binding protein [Bradyrhizobium sp. Arg237L]|uniref:ABC transporter substrate-binding protein n=1 Tax=Bradyrhizobium sp. Arg237L TaxID=3003352 RepID=UPI00249F2D76|nr:ABC transporter substrate-binding protein [Bradyrhizobium sp. Arg237L]MDI4238299.1 ABC transporter substrate-binding protein [Bradyrhizobium sp. Arg237L]